MPSTVEFQPDHDLGLRCRRCGSANMAIEPMMRHSQHADGEPLVYWRCGDCRALTSRLSGEPMGEGSEVRL